METPFHVWAADAYAAELQQTEEGREDFATYRAEQTDPELAEYVAAIGQPPGGWTDGQIAAFGRLHTLFANNGPLNAFCVPVPAAPSDPVDRSADRATLQSLPEYFTAVVHDEPGNRDDDSDGILSWTPEIAAKIPGGWADPLCALDIGPIDASRTLLRLIDCPVTARWPAGSPVLWLFGFARFTDWLAWTEDSFAFVVPDTTG